MNAYYKFKKFNVRVLLFVACLCFLGCSPEAAKKKSGIVAPPTGGPTNTNPSDPADQVLFGNPLDAQTGDWDSAGMDGGRVDAPVGTIEGEFSFQCSGFMQDQIKRHGKSCESCDLEEYILYRWYEFEISNDSPSVEFDNLDYKMVASVPSEDQLAKNYSTKEDLKLTTPKASVLFQVKNKLGTEDDPYYLINASITVGQELGGVIVKSRGSFPAYSISHMFSNSHSLKIEAKDETQNLDEIPRIKFEIKCSRDSQ